MYSWSKARLRLQLLKLFWICLFWMIIAIGQFLFEYEVLINHQALPDNFHFWPYLLSDLVATFLGGLIGGSIMVFYLEDWFRDRPYGHALALVFLVYTIISLLISYLGLGLLYSLELKQSIFAPEVQSEIKGYLWSLEYFKNYSLWLIIVFLTIASLLVNDKYGPGVLKDFLLGKYFQPTREERIFMFLDLRGSTSIAEKLGEERYFHFLKDLFRDATLPIINTRGEIYQYVGDEIIITWKMHLGLKNANCIRCFYSIQETLIKRYPFYLKQYGIEPEFKAGLHYGMVMTGEIGVVKRDITFSGDVLNTASRIQSKCNEFGVDFLVSKFLLDKIALPPNDYDVRPMGTLLLRGKQNQITLYTL